MQRNVAPAERWVGIKFPFPHKLRIGGGRECKINAKQTAQRKWRGSSSKKRAASAIICSITTYSENVNNIRTHGEKSMEIKTDAIVLQTVDYKDNDKILTLFSPSLGKITAGAKGVKKATAKLAFAAQPFCFAEYVLAEKGGRYTLTSAYLHESFFALRTDLLRFYAACAAAEITRAILQENEEYEGLFIALIECLKSLALSFGDVAEALISFTLVALRESGYPIDLTYLEENGGEMRERLWFDFADGRFTIFEDCIRGERASVSTYHVLRQCAGLTYDGSATQGGKKRALRLLKAYLADKLETGFDNLGELIRLYDE